MANQINRDLVDPIADLIEDINKKTQEPKSTEARITPPQSKGKKKRTDSKENLEQLYWTERKSETMIMYEIGYDSPQDVVNKLIKWGIPVRGPDRSRVNREFIHQNDDTTQLRNVSLIADTTEIISEFFNVEQFRQFNLLLSLSKTGTPTGAFIQVFVEFSFDERIWFPIRDYPWNKAYETNNSIDATNGVLWSRTGLVPGKLIRVRFVASGTTLSATAFFTVDQVQIALF